MSSWELPRKLEKRLANAGWSSKACGCAEMAPRRPVQEGLKDWLHVVCFCTRRTTSVSLGGHIHFRSPSHRRALVAPQMQSQSELHYSTRRSSLATRQSEQPPRMTRDHQLLVGWNYPGGNPAARPRDSRALPSVGF